LLCNDLFIWVQGLLGNILIFVVVCMLYLENLEFRCLFSKFLGPSEFVACEGTFYFFKIFLEFIISIVLISEILLDYIKRTNIG
jgi:hypothetical protein